ncbi:MAG: translocation/assembly module TamB domain-containing protein [Cyanobacteriota bacterium]|nr:translocation/assembly module TamB domain-containing protein [Cyanobacteriota bacterium]
MLLPWPRRPLLIGAGALGSAALALVAADRLAASLYRQLRPSLEQTLSRQLGQPVVLGGYGGLRPWGLQLGPSQIKSQAGGRSSVRVDGARLALAPIASLRQGLASLQIELDGAAAELIANDRGRYWTLPAARAGVQPPAVALRLVLRQPATITLPRQGGRYNLSGAVDLQLRQRTLALDAVLRPAGRAGSLAVKGRGGWRRGGQWRLAIGLQQLQLRDLTTLLPVERPLKLPGQASGQVVLQLGRRGSSCRGRLELRDLLWGGASRGVERLRLGCQKQVLTLQPTTLRWGSWQAQTSGRARWVDGKGLTLESVVLRRGRSSLQVKGSLQPNPSLHSRLQWRAADLPQGQRLPGWLQQQQLLGRLVLGGSWRQPRLQLDLDNASDPLLGPWRAQLDWSVPQQQLRLRTLRSAQLQASGTLPLRLRPGGGLESGPLQLDLTLSRYPLARLRPLLGARLAGSLDAQGRISGPLQALVPDLELAVRQLGAGPLVLDETWQGRWQGAAGGGGMLNLRALAPAPAASLQAALNRQWLPQQIALQRGKGELTLRGKPRAYRWQANGLLLDGLALRLGPRELPQSLRGRFSGTGELSLQPLGFSGNATLERPAVLGLRLKRAELQGIYRGERYQLSGELQTHEGGRVSLSARGGWRGALALQLRARGLMRNTLQQLVDLWPQWQGRERVAAGRASDLGTLMISTLGQSLQQQLVALAQARAELSASGRDGGESASLQQRLLQLQMRLDGDLELRGPNARRLQVDLAAKGHLWLGDQEQDVVLSQEPLTLRIEGPLTLGRGSFDVSNLPLSLLALLTPVPESLRGSLALKGRYGLGRGTRELNLDLALAGAELAGRRLDLSRGEVVLAGDNLRLDLALQAEGASSSIDLAGVLPLDPDRQALELRLASRGDGLRILTALAEPDLDWRRGSADLQLLLRGSVRQPIANGFLRIRDGQLSVLQQTVEALEATVVFDFEQLLVQELKAEVGRAGRITASGHLGLVNPTSTQPPLEVQLSQVPFSVPRITASADGRLEIGGSLRDLQMGGEVAIQRGSINAQPGRLVAARPTTKPRPPRQSVSQLLQENWDFQSPLLLIGAEVETNSSRNVLQAVPRFKPLGFNDLKLRLGPDLKIVIPNAASFKSAGLLRLSGRLDPSLRARGVVRLLQGRLNLFTTSFSLDPDAPNVAVFTPALGLVPYLDIAMRTRIADSVAITGLGSAGSPSLAEIEAQGGLSNLNQLNLVRITVTVSGPADRLAQSIRLRSSPPLPESRLIALIGGNSLAGLGGAGAGAAIATVVGQTLLSPVLGGLSDAFGQRVSFALYPTYLNPNVTNQAVLQSRRLAPQLVLGSEIGLDITERFNVSVLAAPNRSDVPPQLNLNIRATDILNVQGSVDSQGALQGQLQLFFRF